MSAARHEITIRVPPHSKKVGRIGLVAEEWCTRKVVVKSREGLPRIDITKLHEGRFILWLEYKWDTQVELVNVIRPVNATSYNQAKLTLGM